MLCSSSLLVRLPLEVVMNDTLIEVSSHEGDDHVQRGNAEKFAPSIHRVVQVGTCSVLQCQTCPVDCID